MNNQVNLQCFQLIYLIAFLEGYNNYRNHCQCQVIGLRQYYSEIECKENYRRVGCLETTMRYDSMCKVYDKLTMSKKLYTLTGGPPDDEALGFSLSSLQVNLALVVINPTTIRSRPRRPLVLFHIINPFQYLLIITLINNYLVSLILSIIHCTVAMLTLALDDLVPKFSPVMVSLVEPSSGPEEGLI